MVKKIAFLFPGQGSQAVGMGKDIYENYEAAKNIYDTADKVLDKSITTLCFDGPEENLKQTVNTQPCIVTTSIAMMEALRSFSTESVDLHFVGEIKPILIKSSEDESLTQLVLPIRTY